MSSKTIAPVTAGDVMTQHPIVVGLGTTASELAEIFEGNDISGVPVVDGGEHVVGVVSKTDLIHRFLEEAAASGSGESNSFFEAVAEGLSSGSILENLGTVETIMTPDPVTAHSTERVDSLARRMADEGVHRIVVVDDESRAIGLVTTLDVLKVFPASD